jgi:hypothetical protein
MPTSMSRRIRRIGLLPTTYTETVEQVGVTKNGQKQVETITHRHPERNREDLSPAAIYGIASDIRAEYRERRRKNK